MQYKQPSNTLLHANGFAHYPLAAGPAPAQAAPDLSSTLESLPGKLKEFGSTLEDKARAAIDHIKQKEILTKTRLGPFRARMGGVCVCVSKSPSRQSHTDTMGKQHQIEVIELDIEVLGVWGQAM